MPELIRVKDKDTGHVRTVHEAEVAHGNYQVLQQDPVDPVTGTVAGVVLAESNTAAAKKPAAKKSPAKRPAAKKTAATPPAETKEN